MEKLDVYYRALSDYRGLTSQKRECQAFCKLIAKTDTGADKMVITKTVCTVDEDWISEIENGLDFIDKAIKEDRQFIYSNGEVVPIEKVKHVSQESVRHLARHTNLLGKTAAEGGDLVPDSLYTVERLNDYAVYENRFLYMLLCYLRDFVGVRYNKITDLTNKYDGMLTLRKEAVLSKHKITYSVELHEEIMDDKYLRETNSIKETIDRIDIIQRTIQAFISTPLMQYAAKTPMLKPPITKTNVLKMDNNFKRVLSLYEYINAYTADGYTVEEQKIFFDPFKEDMAQELSEACGMLSFVMYEYGLGIKQMLKNNYENEEQRRKHEAILLNKEKLEALKKKLKSAGVSPEEYIFELERQLKAAEAENEKIEPLYNDIYVLKEENAGLEARIGDMKLSIEKLNVKNAEAEVKHLEEMEAVRSEAGKRIHEAILAQEEESRRLEAECNEKIELADARMRKAEETFRAESAALHTQLAEAEEKLLALTAEYEKTLEEKLLCEARIKGIRAQSGEMGEADDFTEKESFEALEKEFEAFEKFYKAQWSEAKKKIRKRLLNFDNIKGKKGQDE